MGHLHWFSWSLIVLIITAAYHAYAAYTGKVENRKWFVIAATIMGLAILPPITAYSQDYIATGTMDAQGFGTCLFCLGLAMYLPGVFSIFYMPYRLMLTVGKRKQAIGKALKGLFISILVFYAVTLSTVVYFNMYSVYPNCVAAKTDNRFILMMSDIYGVSNRKPYWRGVLSALCEDTGRE